MYEVVQSLEGTEFDDGRIPDVELLAFKLYSHAISSYWLYQGTEADVPKSAGGTNFIDNASIIVLTRAALETYLTFFEVFIEPKKDDEFEFAYCLWYLSGKVILEEYDPIIETPEEKLESINMEIRQLRDRIKQTEVYENHTENQQKQILKGKSFRNRYDIASSAGLSPNFIEMVYKYYSGFVHSDGYTSSQLFSSETTEEQKDFAELQLNILMILVSKFILDFTGKFKQSSYLLDMHPEIHRVAYVWSEVGAGFDDFAP
jgi:hypothetical protein